MRDMYLAVLYGGDVQIHFYAPAILFREIVYTSDAHFVELNIEGAIHRAHSSGYSVSSS